MTRYMIYDFKTSKCDAGWQSVGEAQQEINSWNDKEDYDLHIIPTVIVDIEEQADMIIYPLIDKDWHFTTVADFTNEDMLNTDLIDYNEKEPVKVCRMF